MRGVAQRLGRLSLTQRMALMLLWMALLVLVPDALGWQGVEAVAHGARFCCWLRVLFCGAFRWPWCRALKAPAALRRTSRCNLTSTVRADYPQPLQGLVHRLQQTQVNLRAVVGDVRTEVHHFTEAAAEIAQGSHDLSASYRIASEQFARDCSVHGKSWPAPCAKQPTHGGQGFASSK